jgi:hypothetical protein
MNEEFYWELIQFDGTVLSIPPKAVELVKRKISNNEPINTPNAIIPANQVKSFRITDRPFNSQPLLEAASQAFKEPIYVQVEGMGGRMYEAIAARWVKRTVTQDKWNRYYSSIPSYRKLDDIGGMVVMAFVKPIHDIDPLVTPYCTEDEVRKLERA